jgi:hypothetical protein
MSRLPFYLSLATLLLTGASADEAAEKPADKAPEKPKAYELKHRSTFTMDVTARTPFWPIGWDRSKITKPGAAVLAKAPVAKFQLKDQIGYFTVTSLLLGNPPLANINGRGYGEGEYLPVEVGGQPIKIIVKQIRDGGVVLEHEGSQLFVPMKRPQLGTPQPATNLPPPTFKIVIPELK